MIVLFTLHGKRGLFLECWLKQRNLERFDYDEIKQR